MRGDAAARTTLASIGAVADALPLWARHTLGRSPFTPRFDGRDRWLQRTFVVADLGPSAADRIGRVIATEFAA